MTAPNPDAADVARKLTAAQRDFLRRVCTGAKLGLADREEDKVRQSLRRAGLVFVAKKPRRWVASDFGLAVREILAAQATGAPGRGG